MKGPFFVNQTTAASGKSSQYSLELFPGITPAQSVVIASLYANLGSPAEQANLIMGESIFVCPSYHLLRASPGAYRGIFAIPPSYHEDDLPFYFDPLITITGGGDNSSVTNVASVPDYSTTPSSLPRSRSHS
ncbi:hypothetical protein PTI98_009518 [Pleurotus ostreatus]|nr:hypothetical protein PTI98_009518 [Pleurotus ostreatus]